MVQNHPKIVAWVRTSPFKLVNRTDLLPPSSSPRMGRQEWGVFEAIMCVNATRFAGVWDSSRTAYVVRKRMSSAEMENRSLFVGSRDFIWDRTCESVFGAFAEDAAASRNRLMKEVNFMLTTN